jgi:type IV pilus assembly protein PilM
VCSSDLDIGAYYTHLFVLNSMQLIFSREEKFGGMQLIDSIADHYHLSHEQAFDAKNNNTLPDDYETAVLEPFKELILLQIKRTLQFFYSTSQHNYVDHILLAGGVARQSGLAELIQEQIHIPTTVANPLAYMYLGKNVRMDLITNDAPSLMVACGLALRSVGSY